MAISSLNLSSRSPLWCTTELLLAAHQAAEEGLPSEVIGFIFERATDSRLALQILPAIASPWRVQALPQAVVSFAYEVLAQGGKVHATFHTHPKGGFTFSSFDDCLTAWAQWHLLLLHLGNGRWQVMWGENCQR